MKVVISSKRSLSVILGLMRQCGWQPLLARSWPSKVLCTAPSGRLAVFRQGKSSIAYTWYEPLQILNLTSWNNAKTPLLQSIRTSQPQPITSSDSVGHLYRCRSFH